MGKGLKLAQFDLLNAFVVVLDFRGWHVLLGEKLVVAGYLFLEELALISWPAAGMSAERTCSECLR